MRLDDYLEYVEETISEHSEAEPRETSDYWVFTGAKPRGIHAVYSDKPDSRIPEYTHRSVFKRFEDKIKKADSPEDIHYEGMKSRAEGIGNDKHIDLVERLEERNVFDGRALETPAQD